MSEVSNPEGLTFADVVRKADSYKAKAEKCQQIKEGTTDENLEVWLDELIEQHLRDEQRWRAIAQAFGDTDPKSES